MMTFLTILFMKKKEDEENLRKIMLNYFDSKKGQLLKIN